MTLAKAEKKTLQSFHKRAKKIERDSRALAKDVGRELHRQMKKS